MPRHRGQRVHALRARGPGGRRLGRDGDRRDTYESAGPARTRGLYGRDVGRLESFYRELIGLDVVRRGGNNLAGRAVLFTSSPPGEEDHELVLLSNPQGAHVAFRVDLREALAAFYGRATGRAYQYASRHRSSRGS